MPHTNLPSAVLWDLDGTLIDSEPYWHQGEKALAADHSKEWSNEDSRAIIGKSLYDSSQILKNHLESDLHPHEIIDRLTNHVISQLETELIWRPGARELLLEMREAGIRTALVTMSMRRMALSVVDSIGFDAFDLVVAGDDVEFGKPHPQPYLRAMEGLGVIAAECLALEDSPTGLASAEAAGVRTIGIENLLRLQPSDGRTVIPSLEGFRLSHLAEVFGANA